MSMEKIFLASQDSLETLDTMRATNLVVIFKAFKEIDLSFCPFSYSYVRACVYESRVENASWLQRSTASYAKMPYRVACAFFHHIL